MYEYAGYSLEDTSKYELTERIKKYLDAVVWVVDNKDSIRGAERNCMVSRSALSKYINTELQSVSNELYRVVRKIIAGNKKRLCQRRLN